MTVRFVIVAALVVGAYGRAGADPVEYSVNAQTNYERGMRELDHREWSAATNYFDFIIQKFPYSKYEWLAELRLADVQLGAGHYAKAADAYRAFIHDHAEHEMVKNGYAASRLTEAKRHLHAP
jgi:outer membrane protein assembly factor BamD (BamD/ComL family)